MKVLDRFKLELNNQQYFTDSEYTQLLLENDLTATDEYVKSEMQKSMLYTVLDVLEAVANDVDIMSSMTTTEFTTLGQAYQYVENRIAQVKDKIAAIPEENDDYNCFSLMYTRNQYAPVTRRSVIGLRDVETLTHSDIDSYLNE